MKKLKELNGFKKSVLVVLAGLVVLFAFIYAALYQQEGRIFRDTFLKKAELPDRTVYTGTGDGKKFTISIDDEKNTTIFIGGKQYGPYKVLGGDTTKETYPAVTILQNDEVVFSGSLKQWDDSFIVFKDDGSLYVGHPIYNGDVPVLDEHGKIIDVNEPTADEIIYISKDMDLSRRATEWGFYVLGTILSVITALSIIFADEIFVFYMSFRIADPETAEPSSFELGSRYFSWVVMPFIIILIYFMGLRF